jgi:hypothetical protein
MGIQRLSTDGVAIATDCFNRVLAPEGEILSFAPPKESIQRKSGIRVSFLLDTFLWTSKEKYPARRCGNRLQIAVAIATL